MKKFSFIAYMLFVTRCVADAPIIQSATASQSAGAWSISVTVSHPDTGWDHYADGWEVLDKDGKRLGLRVLAHPHVQEQPFTRSLSGVVIPQGTTVVYVRTRCIVDGWSESRHEVALTN